MHRYCAKLPSDTFTRLTPEWNTKIVEIDKKLMYVCSLRLPINSPLKYIVSVSIIYNFIFICSFETILENNYCIYFLQFEVISDAK